MNVHQLRRWSDKVDSSLRNGGEAAKDGWNSVYGKAMNHPGAAAAVVLGTGVAAGLLWLANRNGTFSKKRKQIEARVRRAPARAKRSRAAAS
ncbi:hypothetical protein AYO46_05690 [Betaproteobacteria bacterium SCGC AG-212-J23]|nr:hypothetical protein AYO46_05690 [Betaproteobacteria bacterium SCGC AG-212-J23]